MARSLAEWIEARTLTLETLAGVPAQLVAEDDWQRIMAVITPAERRRLAHIDYCNRPYTVDPNDLFDLYLEAQDDEDAELVNLTAHVTQRDSGSNT